MTDQKRKPHNRSTQTGKGNLRSFWDSLHLPTFEMKKPGDKSAGVAKRGDQSRTRSHRSKTPSHYEAPGVVFRNTGMAQPLTKEARTTRPAARPRREKMVRGVPEASLRLPTLPRFKGSWRMLSFLLVVLVGVSLYFVLTAPLFRVSDLQTQGLVRIQPYDISAVLGVNGQPAFALDPSKLQQSLINSFPEFITATVRVDLPNTVVISVTERLPVLIWQQEGRTDLVDADGMAFPLRGEELDLALPVVAATDPLPGTEPTQAITDTEVTKRPWYAFLPLKEEETTPAVEPQRALSVETVKAILLLEEFAPDNAPLVFTLKNGFGWKDSSGWDVYFGDLKDVETKLKVYQTILRHLDKLDLLPSMISVEWVDAPYYRLESQNDE